MVDSVVVVVSLRVVVVVRSVVVNGTSRVAWDPQEAPIEFVRVALLLSALSFTVNVITK